MEFTASSSHEEPAENVSKQTSIKTTKTTKKSDSNSEETTNSCVYLIHSNRALSELESFITKKCSSVRNEDLGFMHIVWDGNEETCRTVVLMKKKIYDSLVEQGYGKRIKTHNFYIVPYILGKNNFPRSTHEYKFFIPLPRELSVKECRDQLSNTFVIMTEFGILPQDSYNIDIPVPSRQGTKHKGRSYISFDKNVVREVDIVFAKVLIDGYSWYRQSKDDTQTQRLKCRWYKKNQKSRKGFTVPALNKVKNGVHKGEQHSGYKQRNPRSKTPKNSLESVKEVSVSQNRRKFHNPTTRDKYAMKPLPASVPPFIDGMQTFLPLPNITIVTTSVTEEQSLLTKN